MLQENLDAVRAAYEGWAKGNFRAGADLLDPDVVFIVGREFPDGGVYMGPEGVRDYMGLFLGAWVDLTIQAEEFIEADGSVVVAVHQRGTGRESRIPAEDRFLQVWTFRGQRVVRLETMRDRADALEAAGLRE